MTPTPAASHSSLFKAFFEVLDLLDDHALAGKPVLIGATGCTARHSLVLESTVRPLFAYLGAVVVPTSVFAAPEDWGGAAAPDLLVPPRTPESFRTPSPDETSTYPPITRCSMTPHCRRCK